ncbi:hypothetical protein HYX70_02890 [Candidatus Saccharibacteria bacterium]|nr:hypothetical protein [Candidatus Saccharibacteria bacterium]
MIWWEWILVLYLIGAVFGFAWLWLVQGAWKYEPEIGERLLVGGFWLPFLIARLVLLIVRRWIC